MQNYETFSLESRSARAVYQSLQLTEITDRRITRALESRLAESGLQKDDATPDCIVTFFTTSKTKTEVNDLSMAGGYAYRRGPYRGWAGYSHYSVDQYEEGTLIVDIIDAETKQMVWRGADSKRLRHSAPTEKDIAKIVDRILREFPPEPGK